ncbi:helix-turn-helix domain-containing protein [Bacillus toyonensis]|uniref:helix-turn-helix domain-containing protein n=1 Tax=Bacillus toyonensis TaxID=155322 RepID=UPI0025420A32|nr:helix-turn-helix transcriptional regulator [Bacillus toyonensis]WIG43098.1 helix-turn-helix transcriptional regulator [Bacillus toyonensis]
MTKKFYVDVGAICNNYKISQRELAERAGIKEPSLSRIKRTKTISLVVLNKLAVALNERDISKLISVNHEEAGL